MTKRIIAWLLVVVMTFGLIACSKKPVEPATPTETTATEQTAAPTVEQTVASTAESATEQTKAPTSKPTTVATVASTTKPTVAHPTVPTTVATKEPTTAATTAAPTKATTAATTAPTTAATTAPTTAATTAPTTVATTAPTTVATAAPTTAPTTAATTEPTATRKALAPLLELRGELPALKSREEMLETLQKEVYGYMPAAPTNIEFTTNEITSSEYCNGKAELYAIVAKCTVNGQEFSFPFRMAMPKNADGKVPFFLNIGFTKGKTSRYQSTEAVIDKGYAIIYYDYRDIASDDGKFDNGLSAILYPDGKRGDTDPGKVAMWAWGAHRMMDFAETISDKLDLTRSAVCGHSRTAKAALLAGATDTRVQFTYSNESGCAGSAISRRKAGENIARITDVFPYWFCKNYKQWAAREAEMPFDQHWLLASIAPRKVLVGSASKDINADPLSEQLGCLAASPAFENGFACDVMAVTGEAFLEGDIGYHLREGSHAFTETDWLRAVEFIDYHTGK